MWWSVYYNGLSVVECIISSAECSVCCILLSQGRR